MFAFVKFSNFLRNVQKHISLCVSTMSHLSGTSTRITSMNHIQVSQNAALRLTIGTHQMSSIYQLHREAKMFNVLEHSELFSAHYVVACLEEEHTCHNIIKVDPPPGQYFSCSRFILNQMITWYDINL